MSVTRSMRIACIAAVLAFAALASAQQAGSPDVAATLRSKDLLSDQDKAQLRQWILDRVSGLEQAAKANDLKAMFTIKRNMVEAAAASAAAPATAGFRTAYGEISAPIFQPYFGIGEDARASDPRVALYLAQVLGSLKQINTLDVMLAALGSKYPAVRFVAAKDMRDLRSEIAAAMANQLARIITAVQQAGAKEGDAPTAKMLYEAVDFRAQVPASAPQVIEAMLTMLQGRSQFYRNDLVTNFYPDAYAMNILQTIDLPDAQKSKAIQIVNSILQGAAERWALVAREYEDVQITPENPYDAASSRQWHLRYQLAYATQEAEALLKKLGVVPAGGSAPDMASLMTALSIANKVDEAAADWDALTQPKPPATAPVSATP